MGKKVPNNMAQRASTNAIASPNPLFFILSIPFKKSQLLAQQAALSLSYEGATLAANHLKFVFHIVWSPLADPIRGPTIPGLENGWFSQ